MAEAVPPKRSSERPIGLRTAYAFFLQEHYRRAREQMKTKQPQPIIRIIGRQWRTLDQSEKAKYIAMEQADRQRLKEAKAKSNSDKEAKVERKPRNKKKNYYGPGKTRNAFVFYVKQNFCLIRQRCPTKTHEQIVRELAIEWKAMDKNQKKECNDLAQADKSRKEQYKVAKMDEKNQSAALYQIAQILKRNAAERERDEAENRPAEDNN